MRRYSILLLFVFVVSSVLFLSFYYFGEKRSDIESEGISEEMREKLYKVSLPFVENKGQLPEEVEFYASTFGGTVFVTDSGKLVYSLGGEDKGWVIEEVFGSVGEVKGLERSNAVVNIFKGNKEEEWRRGIPTYEVVSMGEVARGVELRLKAYGNQVEKLFYVEPGARVGDVVVEVVGGKGLDVSEEGGVGG